MTRPPRVDVPVDPARLAAWREAAAGQPLAAFLREAGDREAERRADKTAWLEALGRPAGKEIE
jgi:hypothetical protein